MLLRENDDFSHSLHSISSCLKSSRIALEVCLIRACHYGPRALGSARQGVSTWEFQFVKESVMEAQNACCCMLEPT